MRYPLFIGLTLTVATGCPMGTETVASGEADVAIPLTYFDVTAEEQITLSLDASAAHAEVEVALTLSASETTSFADQAGSYSVELELTTANLSDGATQVRYLLFENEYATGATVAIPSSGRASPSINGWLSDELGGACVLDAGSCTDVDRLRLDLLAGDPVHITATVRASAFVGSRNSNANPSLAVTLTALP